MATEAESVHAIPADWTTLPDDLPVPTDDGAADHLRAGSQVELPEGVSLRATATARSAGETAVDLRALSFEGPVLVFVYPRTGQPGVPNPVGWDAIPGARGCTPELCGIRDGIEGLRAARPGLRVFALSTQSTAYQSEAAARLGLPYAILSDEGRAWSGALGLPTFEDAAGTVLLKRITLLLHGGKVVRRDYPVFPSDRAARRALDLLQRGL